MGQGTRTSPPEAHAARKKHVIRTQREEDGRRHTGSKRHQIGQGKEGQNCKISPKINVLMEQNEGGIVPLWKAWRQSRRWDKGAAGAWHETNPCGEEHSTLWCLWKVWFFGYSFIYLFGVVLWNGIHSRPLPPYYPRWCLLGEDALEPPWRAGSSRVSGPESLQLKVWRAVTSMLLAAEVAVEWGGQLCSFPAFWLGVSYFLLFSKPNKIISFLNATENVHPPILIPTLLYFNLVIYNHFEQKITSW